MNGFEILDWFRRSDDDMRRETFGQDQIERILIIFNNEELAEGIALYEEGLKEKEERKKKRDAFLNRRRVDACLEREVEGQ